MAVVVAFTAQVAVTFFSASHAYLYTWGIQGGALAYAFLSYGLLVLTYPIARIFKRRVNPITLTYIFTVGTMVSYVIGHGWAEQYPTIFAEFRVYDTQNFLTGWWQVPLELCRKLIAGNVAVDWAAWTPSIFYWTAQLLTFYFLSSAIAIIFRHQWMDIEKIPFPLTMAGYEILKVVNTEGSAKKDLRPFVIGILLGLAFEVPVFLQGVLPWFPDIYSWRTNTCCSGTACLPPDNPLTSNIVGLSMMIKNPLYFAIFYLSPLSISFNVWFWTFVMMVLEQIAYYMGYYTGIFSTGGTCRIWSTSNAIVVRPPFEWTHVSGVGGVLSIVMFSIILRRSYLVETVKAALKRPSKLSDIEKNEPMTYRNAYIMFIVGCILMTGLIMSVGVDLVAALVIIFPTALVFYFSGVLVWGYTGYNLAWTCQPNSSWAVRTLWPQIPNNYSTDWVMSYWLAIVPGNNFQGWEKGLFGPSQCFRMGNLTNTNAKNIYLIATITIIIALITATLTSVWLINAFGSARIGTSRCSIVGVCFDSLEYIGALPSLPEMYTYAAYGFIITSILSILHANYVWFPFEPLGFVIATSAGQLYVGAWDAFLGAWIIKYLVLKIGGSKLYERSLGVVGGYVAGQVITCFAATILGDIRFFYPF
jgi:hypothetical protein